MESVQIGSVRRWQTMFSGLYFSTPQFFFGQVTKFPVWQGVDLCGKCPRAAALPQSAPMTVSTVSVRTCSAVVLILIFFLLKQSYVIESDSSPYQPPPSSF